MYSFCLQSEERGTPSRRSKSEGPHRIPNGQVYPVGGDVVDAAGIKSNDGPAQVHNPTHNDDIFVFFVIYWRESYTLLFTAYARDKTKRCETIMLGIRTVQGKNQTNENTEYESICSLF